ERNQLSMDIIELSLSQKANTKNKMIDNAISNIRKGHIGVVPKHIKDRHYKGAKELGNSIGYKNPHDYNNNIVKQQYLPDSLKHKQYFKDDGTSKYESFLNETYKNLKPFNKY